MDRQVSELSTAEAIFTQYHRFDDGYLVAFDYACAPDGLTTVEMIFHGKDDHAEGNLWRSVKVTVEDVQELVARWQKGYLNRIICGVKLLRFGELWCVDVDGVYNGVDDPASLEEVRAEGEFYVVGRRVTAQALDVLHTA